MTRKRKTSYEYAGRPPVDPMQKVGRPVRALVTPPVENAIMEGMELHNVVLSDYFRLALFRQLEHDGLLNPYLRIDPTFLSLREKGLV